MIRFSPGVVGGGREHLLGRERVVGYFFEWVGAGGKVSHGWDARDPWRAAARAVEGAKGGKLMKTPRAEKVLYLRGKRVILRGGQFSPEKGGVIGCVGL